MTNCPKCGSLLNRKVSTIRSRVPEYHWTKRGLETDGSPKHNCVLYDCTGCVKVWSEKDLKELPIGSDYSEEILNSPVSELNETEDCKACEGRGWNIFNTSPEGDKDICPDCWGSKVLYPLDIFNSIGIKTNI